MGVLDYCSILRRTPVVGELVCIRDAEAVSYHVATVQRPAGSAGAILARERRS